MQERKRARLMLPGNWHHITPVVGLNRVSAKDFEGRLYDSLNVDSSGVPSLLAHPYGFAQSLKTQPPNPEAMGQFSCLLRGIFLGIIDVIEEDLPNNMLAKVLQSFERGFDKFYVLKWRGMVIGGIYPSCFVFPGAKFVRASLYEMYNKQSYAHPEPKYKGITFQTLREEVERKTRQNGPGLVKALFALWIKEIVREMGLHELGATNSPLWLQRLQDVSNSEWRSTINAPAESIDRFTNRFGMVPLEFDGNISHVPIRKIKGNIFCKRIVRFNTGKLPDIPVKSENLPMIDIENTYCIVRGDEIVYEIQLKGWPQVIEWSPNEVVPADTGSILLFPSFRTKEWNINYVYFAPSPVFGGEEPHVRLINDNFSNIGELSRWSGCHTNEPIRYIEILLRGEQTGVFKDNRDLIAKGEASISISLDFGTTHSSIGIRDQKTGEYQLFHFEDMTYDLLETGYFYEDADEQIKKIRKGCSWFPPAAFDGSLSVLPSELVFVSESVLPEGDTNLDEPIKRFTIPHPQIERDGLHKLIVANFKWNPTEPFSREKLIKTYIKIVLHMALAVLRRKHLCSNVSVVATFPLAFGRKMHNEFKEMLVGPDGHGGLLSEVSKQTGVFLELAIVNRNENVRELIAESYAAKVFCSPSQSSAELVVDIGGGSTDIALSIDEEEFVDSFQYGANRYLEYLAREFPTYPNDINDVNERFIALQKKVRGEGIIGLLKIYPPAQRATAQQSIDRFFQGLFEYLLRLLKAAGADKANLFPVGNGWRLIEGYVAPNNNISDYVNSWFGNKNINFTITLPPGMDYKGQVCKGAMRIADSGWYVSPKENEYSRTILGGDIVVAGRSKRWDETVPTGPVSDQPYGIDVTPFVESLPFSPRLDVDLDTISGQLAAHCRSALYPCPGGLFGLNRSVFAIFLETIYPEYYL